MIAGARLLWFVISFGGFIACLLAVVPWLLLRPAQRAPRVALALVLLAYAALGSYGLAETAALRLSAPFHPLTREDVPPGRVAVVLLGSGSTTFVGWQGATTSILEPIGITRAMEAARVAALLDAPWIISSGGTPEEDDSDAPSGVTMREFLIQIGVPAGRVVEEHESRTTREQAVIVGRMLESLKADHIVLVTSPIHMRRSLAAFRAVGIDAIPAVAREPAGPRGTFGRYFPSLPGLALSAHVVHEAAGLLYYRLRGWHR